MNPSVKVTLSVRPPEQAGMPLPAEHLSDLMVVDVHNLGTVPFDPSLWFESRFEERLPDGRTRMGHDFGLMPSARGEIAPGEARLYFVLPDEMHTLKNLVASLSPEQYRILVKSAGREIASIPGSQVGELIDKMTD